MLIKVAVAMVLTLTGAQVAAAEPTGCVALSPPAPVGQTRSRPVSPTDIAMLRDIGPVSGSFDAAILGVSPDGSRVAFQVRRGEAGTSGYCLGMFVLNIRGITNPLLVDQGGTFINASNGFAGLTAMPAGYAAIVTPRWSPDGRWIAFLRRDQGVTQVWRARSTGGFSEPVTQLSYDATDFRWTSDGRSLVVAGRPSLADQRQAVEMEATRGFLFDDRFNPVRGNAPFPRDPAPTEYVMVDAETHQIRPSTGAERDIVDPKGKTLPNDAMFFTQSPAGDTSWASPVDPTALKPSTVLHIKMASGRERICETTVCDGVVGLWWSTDGREVRFLKREGWQNSQLALYRWRLSRATPERIMLTDDYLIGCQAAGDDLICARETALRPRHLVRLDRLGRIHELFDPNPEFASIRLGTVERLRWRNSYGLEAYGDLVLPPDYRPGERLPLVVVGYISRGFLRGGVGDEYPIFPFAAHGFAVLSFNRPSDIGFSKGAKTYDDVDRLNLQGWADNRSVEDAMETGIELVVAKGIADPARVGLTGLSNGSVTVQYTIINSKATYAAAALSSCGSDPIATGILAGPGLTAELRQFGYPRYSEDGHTFWRDMSIAMNVEKIKSPLLLQVSDDEYLGCLGGYTALKEGGKPVEMYVFPGEHHIKWQPDHRANLYERNLDWFDFWLRGHEDPAPMKRSQYARWRDMRTSIER